MIEERDRLIHELHHNMDWMERRRAARMLGKRGGREVVEALIAALDDKDDDVRQAVILALGEAGDVNAKEHLFKHKIYHAANPDVRWAANWSVAKLQGRGDIRAIEELLTGVDDSVWLVRNSASDALIQQIHYLEQDGDPDCIKLLLRILAASEFEIREKVVDVLVDKGRAYIDEYIEALFSISENVRAGAAQILGKLKARRAANPLKKLLVDENRFVRFQAAKALGRIGAPEAIQGLIDALGDVAQIVRDAAVTSLTAFGARAVEPLLLAYRYSKRKEQRRTILQTLGRLKSPRALPALIEALGDSHYMVRLAAIDAICATDEGEVVTMLIEMLATNDMPLQPLVAEARSHRYRNVRVRAIRTLGELKDSAAVAMLKELSADPDDLIADEAALALEKIGLDMWKRGGAIYCLGELGNLKAVEPLIDCLGDPNRDIRVEATRALGRLRDRRAVKPLLECLGNDDALLRIEAIRVLGQLGGGNPFVVQAIVPRLKDTSHDVRSEAAKALGRLADCDAIEALVEALADDYWSVQRDVRNSLNNLKCLLPGS